MTNPLTSIAGSPAPARLVPDKAGADKLREHCREFEAVLVQQMFKAMRQSVPDGGLFEKNSRQEMFLDLIDLEVARGLAQGTGVGVARNLYRQLATQPDTAEPPSR